MPARNSRLDEIQAAVLRVKLPRLDGWNAARVAIANRYRARIGHPKVTLPDAAGPDNVAHLFVVRTGDRPGLAQHLRAHHVPHDIHYPVPDHRQPAAAGAFADVALPVTERLAAEVLTLPCFPEMTGDEVDLVAEVVNRWDSVTPYSLIVPVYGNEDSIHDLLAAVERMNVQLDGRLEAVFVVDGSPDKSAELLQALLPDQTFASRLVLLSRNFGSFAAIRAGLQHATGDVFAVMAADLQEPPELALEFFRLLGADECDVVVGTRQDRDDPLLSRLSARLFWGVYRRLVVPSMPPGGVDIFGCNRVFRDTLLACEEANSSLVALLFWLGFRRREVAYTRLPRLHGTSGWTLQARRSATSWTACSRSPTCRCGC